MKLFRKEHVRFRPARLTNPKANYIHQAVKALGLTAALCLIQGCTSLEVLQPEYYLPQSANAEDVEAPLNAARLILVRPRESLLPVSSGNPVLIYQGAVKIGELAHGRYITFDGTRLPEDITLHWFDKEHPKISKTIDLSIKLKPGESQTVKLVMQDNELLAELLTKPEAASALPWLAEADPLQASEKNENEQKSDSSESVAVRETSDQDTYW